MLPYTKKLSIVDLTLSADSHVNNGDISYSKLLQYKRLWYINLLYKKVNTTFYTVKNSTGTY